MTADVSSPSRRPRVGVLFGQQVDDLDPLIDYGRACAERDARLWLGQSLAIESHLALAAMAGRGVSVETGLGVAVAPLMTPSLAWAQASSIAQLTGRAVTACYGFGSLAAAESLRGQPMPAPARWMRRFVGDVAVLRDRGPRTPGQPAVELGCGVLRPAMARQAAAVSDAVVTWLTPVDHLARTLIPALAEGAAGVGRRPPRVVSIVPFAVRHPGRDPVRLAATAVGQHIRLPHYADMLRSAGADLCGARAHDLRATLRVGVFAYGSPQDIVTALSDHLAAGTDEIVLHAGSVGLAHGHTAALTDVHAVLEALDDAMGPPAPRDPAQVAAGTPVRHRPDPATEGQMPCRSTSRSSSSAPATAGS